MENAYTEYSQITDEKMYAMARLLAGSPFHLDAAAEMQRTAARNSAMTRLMLFQPDRGIMDIRADCALPVLREWPITVEELAQRIGCSVKEAHNAIHTLRVRREPIVKKNNPANPKHPRYVWEQRPTEEHWRSTFSAVQPTVGRGD